jgi:hypothetical protein
MNTAEKYDELEAKLDEAMLRIYELEKPAGKRPFSEI